MALIFAFTALHFVGASICKIGQTDNPCTPLPPIFVKTYDANDADCSGQFQTDIWTDYMWNVCESSTIDEIGKVVKCTGSENTLSIEEYDSKYCLNSPSTTYTANKDECVSYRQNDGTLVKRKMTWEYSSGLTCPSGDVLVGVVKYSNTDTQCEQNRAGEWVEMIPRLDSCFNSTTPTTFTEISRSVSCSGSSATFSEYTDDLFCETNATTFDATSGECTQWTDPSDPTYTEYRRMYFGCGGSSAAFLTLFWTLVIAALQH